MVLCGQETKDYLINYARSLIYTTALGFPFLASIRTAYELLANGETQSVGRIQPIQSDRRFSSTNPWQTVTITRSRVDPTPPHPPTQPKDRPVGSFRGRPFPHISNLFIANLQASSAGGFLPAEWVYCSCHHATHHPGGQGKSSCLSAFRQYGGRG